LHKVMGPLVRSVGVSDSVGGNSSSNNSIGNNSSSNNSIDNRSNSSSISNNSIGNDSSSDGKSSDNVISTNVVKHYCLVYGVYAAMLKIPLQEALTAYYYNAATGMVTNCVKLVPLGQQEGQQILFGLLSLLPELVEQTLTIPRHLAGRCSFAFDIRSMQHERLYSRLYMS
jgi:hypothetical protein